MGESVQLPRPRTQVPGPISDVRFSRYGNESRASSPEPRLRLRSRLRITITNYDYDSRAQLTRRSCYLSPISCLPTLILIPSPIHGKRSSLFAPVAQGIEHWSPEPGVARSIRARRTTYQRPASAGRWPVWPILLNLSRLQSSGIHTGHPITSWRSPVGALQFER